MPALEEVIGRNVRTRREALGSSQAELGKALAPMLGGQGWTRQAVWKAESGGRSFTAAELLALAGALEVTVPQLFETDGDPVHLPGGALPAGVLAGLLGGSNDLDRALRLRAEVRGLRKFNDLLMGMALTNTAQIERLDAALNGAPEPLADEVSEAVGVETGTFALLVNDRLRSSHEKAKALTADPRPDFVDLADIKENNR